MLANSGTANTAIEFEIFKHQYELNDTKVKFDQYKVLKQALGHEEIIIAIAITLPDNFLKRR